LTHRREQHKNPLANRALVWPLDAGHATASAGLRGHVTDAELALGISNPFQLADNPWPAVVNQLIALWRHALGFYSQPDESAALFRQSGAALMLANYGSQQLQLLRAAGADVGYAIPEEGALAWLETGAITRQTKNTALAHAWINYLLKAAPSQALEMRQGLANTITEPSQLRPTDRLVWLQPVEDRVRRQELWERIYSGDRAAKVLAP